jgi:hypothetical protein
MARLNYNANEHEAMREDGAALPKGRYAAVIESTKLGEVRGDKHTQQLEIIWTVVGGEHEGRKVTNWVTVACDTVVAQDIGMRFLRNICEATGMAGFTDTDELCGRQHIIDVGAIKKQKDGKEVEYSEVKRCYPAGSAETAHSAPAESPQTSAPAHAPAQQPTQQAQPTGGATPPTAAKRPPWMK